MAQVTGLGGVFLRVSDPKSLAAWYEKHLGIRAHGAMFLFPGDTQSASIAVTFFPPASDYFPTGQPAMLNFRVDDLDGALKAIIAAGAEVDARRETSEYGSFGWFTDPAGNRVELWQPPRRKNPLLFKRVWRAYGCWE